MMLRFSDGVEFDTGGEPRVERRRDGLYVVGGGMLIPVDSRQEGDDVVASMKKEKQGARGGELRQAR